MTFKKCGYLVLSSIIFLVSYYFIIHHLIINVTPSMPYGIYIEKGKQSISQGDIVAVCLPSPLRKLALEKGYIKTGFYCQGTTPLIKEVIAIPNMDVIVSKEDIQINNHAYPVQFYPQDSRGNLLTRAPEGRFRATGYWVLGTHNPRSWDSRYFGELPAESILCVLKPILTW